MPKGMTTIRVPRFHAFIAHGALIDFGTTTGIQMNTSIKTHEGRLALVTGTAQGIGQAIALAFAERGARVIATDLDLPHEIVNKIGPTAYAYRFDVTAEEDWRSVASETREWVKWISL